MSTSSYAALHMVQLGYKCPKYPKMLLYRLSSTTFRMGMRVQGLFFRRVVFKFICPKCGNPHIIHL